MLEHVVNSALPTRLRLDSSTIPRGNISPAPGTFLNFYIVSQGIHVSPTIYPLQRAQLPKSALQTHVRRESFPLYQFQPYQCQIVYRQRYLTIIQPTDRSPITTSDNVFLSPFPAPP